MFQKTQNAEYLQTITHRVRHEFLVWCEQVMDLVESEFPSPAPGAVLQDIGCNVGQFYKSLKHRGYPLEYRGYDVEPMYLEIALREFPELTGRLSVLDIESEPLPDADLNVMSATFEHLQDPLRALEKILRATRYIAVIRTFVGSESASYELQTPGASRPYPVRQFRMDELVPVIASSRFTCRLIDDRFTAATPKEILGRVRLTQHILLLTRDR